MPVSLVFMIKGLSHYAPSDICHKHSVLLSSILSADNFVIICDWLWENPPLTHKDKYLEIRNSIIQSVISREGLKLHAYNSLQIYSYLIAIRLPTAQCTASYFSHHFRLFLINITNTHIGVVGSHEVAGYSEAQ